MKRRDPRFQRTCTAPAKSGAAARAVRRGGEPLPGGRAMPLRGRPPGHADLHPEKSARIEEDANASAAIAVEEHGLLVYRRSEIIVGLGNLALVADEPRRARRSDPAPGDRRLR